jgi:hypothetical protein
MDKTTKLLFFLLKFITGCFYTANYKFHLSARLVYLGTPYNFAIVGLQSYQFPATPSHVQNVFPSKALRTKIMVVLTILNAVLSLSTSFEVGSPTTGLRLASLQIDGWDNFVGHNSSNKTIT